MKISLNLNSETPASAKAAQARTLEQSILLTRKGDWNARKGLVSQFHPLILSLAHKRTSDPETVNMLVEAGSTGLLVAVRKYRKSVGPDHFRVFALRYIEARMDRAVRGPGLLARMFGFGRR